MIYFLIFSLFSGSIKGPKRPRKVFAVYNHQKNKDIMLQYVYHGQKTYYTNDSKIEQSLQCVGNKILYTAGTKIFWQNISKPRKEHVLGTLPFSLVSALRGKLRRFIKVSPDNSKVLWPKDVDLKIKSFDSKFSLSLSPMKGSRFIHPASWRPGSGELLYISHNTNTGRLLFHFRPIDKSSDRLIISPLGIPVKGVNSFEVYWSRAGDYIAVNLDAKPFKSGSMRRFFIIMKVDSGKVIKLPKGWRFSKFHGFDNKDRLIVTASTGYKKRIYRFSFTAKKHRMKFIERLLKRSVYGYFPSRNIVILHSHYKKCHKPRLLRLRMWGEVKRLLRWTKWTEIIAMDRMKTWGIFRGGGRCNDPKPSLYLMRMDGSLLLREMPKRKFYHLRHLPPGQIAICR